MHLESYYCYDLEIIFSTLVALKKACCHSLPLAPPNGSTKGKDHGLNKNNLLKQQWDKKASNSKNIRYNTRKLHRKPFTIGPAYPHHIFSHWKEHPSPLKQESPTHTLAMRWGDKRTSKSHPAPSHTPSHLLPKNLTLTWSKPRQLHYDEI